MSKRRLPLGEETLPITIVEGKMTSLQDLEQHYPLLYKDLVSRKVFELKVSDELLVSRVKQRHAQGRVATIYRMVHDGVKEFSPEEQIEEMEARTPTGLDFIKAESKLLEEELKVLCENYASS